MTVRSSEHNLYLFIWTQIWLLLNSSAYNHTDMKKGLFTKRSKRKKSKEEVSAVVKAVAFQIRIVAVKK